MYDMFSWAAKFIPLQANFLLPGIGGILEGGFCAFANAPWKSVGRVAMERMLLDY